MKTEILGVKVDNLDQDEVLLKIEEFLGGDSFRPERDKQRYIVTLNPEFLVEARRDGEFKDILNQADISVADGIGLILAARWLGYPLKKRLAGVDLMEAICRRAAEKDWPVFLLGGGEGVAEEAALKLAKEYSGLEIEVWDEKAVSNFGKAGSKDKKGILFVALGAPKQEKWIAANLSKMPSVKLAVGVGGAFDFISGRVRRAPKFIRRAGLEWLWRFGCQPWRFRRIFRAVVVFPWLALKEKLSTDRKFQNKR